MSHYEAPFAFNGLLRKVTVTMDDDQALDATQAARAANLAALAAKHSLGNLTLKTHVDFV